MNRNREIPSLRKTMQSPCPSRIREVPSFRKRLSPNRLYQTAAIPGQHLKTTTRCRGHLISTNSQKQGLPGIDTQMPDGQKGPNGLWIVDLAGLNHYPEMSIPRYGYAREEITPGMEGNITIEQMDPVGKVRTFGMGYVRPYHVYKMWFYGDVPGTHMIRYNINGYYSNIVRFYILEGQGQSMSNPVAISGSTGPRTGSNVVRSGGSYSSSSSSMSMSGGSMRISTSFG